MQDPTGTKTVLTLGSILESLQGDGLLYTRIVKDVYERHNQ